MHPALPIEIRLGLPATDKPDRDEAKASHLSLSTHMRVES